jgi:large subunit ribosomal protein L5
VTEAKAHGEAKKPGGGAARRAANRRRDRDHQAAEGKAASRGEHPARLGVAYKEQIIPALMKEFGYKNPMQVPKVEKVVVNMGLGEAITNNKLIEQAEEQMMAITGQKAVVTRSRKNIANVKLRENQTIGDMANLQKYKMYEFLDRRRAPRCRGARDSGRLGKSFDSRNASRSASRERSSSGDQRDGSEDQGHEHHHRDRATKRAALCSGTSACHSGRRDEAARNTVPRRNALRSGACRRLHEGGARSPLDPPTSHVPRARRTGVIKHGQALQDGAGEAPADEAEVQGARL